MDKNRVLFVGVLGILVFGQSLDYYWLQKDENIKKQAQNGTKTVQIKENSLKNIKNNQKQAKNERKEDKKWLRNINLAEKYQKYIYDECQKYNFDYDLALAVAKYESNFDIYAKNTNSDGSIDQGLFQLNSFYSKKVAQELKITNFNPYNPYHNIKVGIYILATHRDYWLGKGIEGEELNKRLLLSYNRGLQGSRGYIRQYGSTAIYNKKVLEIYKNIKGSGVDD